MSTIVRTTTAIADKALETIRYGKDNVRWLGALMTAIRLDLEHNEGRRVADLASLGWDLSSDCANYLDAQAERLERGLDAAEVQA
ncbi:hypothetical protein [Azotobacter vinelandii]|uniref:hypothetical protein n=1 Tax=Azotobacter vinelandii TaxID=354 RepID=UPI0007749E36|nr:hypothetical protein [Azotobacter vinelandii]